MRLFEDDPDLAEAHQRVTEHPHEGEWSHELLASAAAYEAMKQFDVHSERNGKPASYSEARELMAAFAGAFIDHEVEAKGQDGIDREKAKHLANVQIEQEIANVY